MGTKEKDVKEAHVRNSWGFLLKKHMPSITRLSVLNNFSSHEDVTFSSWESNL